jgi:putative ABC transport system permease protein
LGTPPLWRRYLRFFGPDVEADVEEEFRFHLEEVAEELVARGMAAEAARFEALRRFGDLTHFQRVCRSADQRRLGRVRRTETLSVLGQDLRYALRSLRHQPLFTAIAVITLALGIGANTAIFSVVNGVLIKPLPYHEPDRLVTVWQTMGDGRRIPIALQDYLDWQRRQRGFEDIAVYDPFEAFTLTGEGPAERIRAALVTGNYFRMLGVRPALGRLIAPDDDTPSAPRVVVFTWGLFQSRFAGDPSLIGRTLILNETPYTVIGILPRGVGVLNRDAIVTVGAEVSAPRFARGNHGFMGIGRLKPGIRLEQALADLERVSAELRNEYPKENPGIGSGGEPLMDNVVGGIKPALRMLLVAVGLVLLIACANVANLLLSRSAARQREFALRTALGAARGRLLRQLLTESMVLALLGGVVGLAIAWAGVRLLVSLDPGSVPRLADISLDGTVLFYAAGISLLTGLIFGLMPALQSGKSDLVNSLREGSRGSSAGVGRQATRAMLMVAEVALAVVLLVGAGLMLTSFAKLTGVDPGFSPENVVAGRITFGSRYQTSPARQAAFDDLLSRIRAIPGVQSATVSSDLPLETNWQSGVTFEAVPEIDPSKRPMLNVSVIDPTYFETLKIPLVTGRPLVASDGPGRLRVALVSEAVSRRFFPKGNVVGQRVAQGSGSDSTRWFTIVGVVKDTRTEGLTQESRGNLYLPREQEDLTTAWLMVRSPLPQDQLVPGLRRALQEVDPNVPLALVTTMEDALSEIVAEPRFSMLLLVIFAGVAIVLASVGIYGVISYNVTQRSNEMGVRMALGARRVDVVGLVVGKAMAMAGAGVAIGLLLALWASGILETMLFGVGVHDPLVFGSVGMFLLVVALTAALAPALRAARVDPTIAMRAD